MVQGAWVARGGALPAAAVRTARRRESSRTRAVMLPLQAPPGVLHCLVVCAHALQMHAAQPGGVGPPMPLAGVGAKAGVRISGRPLAPPRPRGPMTLHNTPLLRTLPPPTPTRPRTPNPHHTPPEPRSHKSTLHRLVRRKQAELARKRARIPGTPGVALMSGRGLLSLSDVMVTWVFTDVASSTALWEWNPEVGGRMGRWAEGRAGAGLQQAFVSVLGDSARGGAGRLSARPPAAAQVALPPMPRATWPGRQAAA